MSHAGMRPALTRIHGPRPSRDAARRSRRSHPGLEALESRRLLVGAYVITFDSVVRAGRDSFVPVAEVYGEPEGDQVVSATIDWGDGSAPIKRTAFSYDPNNPSSRHTYQVPGTYYATETFTLNGSGYADYTVSGVATVEVDPQVLLTNVHGPLHVRLGDSTIDESPVAFVTDIAQSDLHVTVDWGDGTNPSAASFAYNPIYSVGGSFGKPISLAQNGGQGFDIRGDHVFTAAGTYTAHVTIAGPGITKVVDVPVVVTDGPIEVDPGTEADVAPGYTAQFSIGQVQDLANVLSLNSVPYTMSIDWGDGTPVAPAAGRVDYEFFTSPRQLVASVFASHAFELPGDYTATLHAVAANGFTAED